TVADPLTAGRRGIAVERGREEDRAALGVEVEDLGRVGRQAEPVRGCPLAHGRAAALEDRDVERVDLRLEEDLDRITRRGAERGRSRDQAFDRLGLADEPLEGPGAALLDVRGNSGERGERPELPAAPRELEGGHVVLDAVVI